MVRLLAFLFFLTYYVTSNAQNLGNRLEINIKRSYHFAKVTPDQDFINYRFNHVASFSFNYGKTFENKLSTSIGFDITNIQLRHSIKTNNYNIPLLEPVSLSPSFTFLFGREIIIDTLITITPLVGYGIGINYWYLYASNNSNFEEDLHSIYFESDDGVFVNSSANAPSPFYQRLIAEINFRINLSERFYINLNPSFSYGINPIVERRFRYVNDKLGVNQTIYSMSNGTLLGISLGMGWKIKTTGNSN